MGSARVRAAHPWFQYAGGCRLKRPGFQDHTLVDWTYPPDGNVKGQRGKTFLQRLEVSTFMLQGVFAKFYLILCCNARSEGLNNANQPNSTDE